jgi:hypothetical protein
VVKSVLSTSPNVVNLTAGFSGPTGAGGYFGESSSAQRVPESSPSYVGGKWEFVPERLANSGKKRDKESKSSPSRYPLVQFASAATMIFYGDARPTVSIFSGHLSLPTLKPCR